MRPATVDGRTRALVEKLRCKKVPPRRQDLNLLHASFFDFTFIFGIFFDINLLDLTILAGTGLFQSLWLIMSTKTGLCLESRSHHLNYMWFSSEKKQQK